jgi:hypothetical protein
LLVWKVEHTFETTALLLSRTLWIGFGGAQQAELLYQLSRWDDFTVRINEATNTLVPLEIKGTMKVILFSLPAGYGYLDVVETQDSRAVPPAASLLPLGLSSMGVCTGRTYRACRA